MNKQPSPKPIFDSMKHHEIPIDISHLSADYVAEDIHITAEFLKAYSGRQGTFNAYRREIERLIHWCTLIAKKSLRELKRQDIEEFVRFCQSPLESWIGLSKPPRFIGKDGVRVSNSNWRPFVSNITKTQRRKGEIPTIKQFELSQSSLRELFAILSSFYNYLLLEEYVYANPVALIRQKSKFIRNRQGSKKIRRLTELQWQYVIKTAKELADKQPDMHERTLFIMSMLYSLYLRISELAESDYWSPAMNHFHRDGDGNWWFTTVGKGHKERDIAVSDATLNALKRWRQHLNLSSLPSTADSSPLLPKVKGSGPVKSTNQIRKIVQFCFDKTIHSLQKDNFQEEAELLNEATVHGLRHTGISDDVKIRPREHVRDDAGHSSSAITDRYIDIELRARHQTAKKKVIDDDG